MQTCQPRCLEDVVGSANRYPISGGLARAPRNNVFVTLNLLPAILYKTLHLQLSYQHRAQKQVPDPAALACSNNMLVPAAAVGYMHEAFYPARLSLAEFSQTKTMCLQHD